MKNLKNTTDISVLIISFNCWGLLNACLKSIYYSDVFFKEVIVIDNASIDGSIENLKKFYPDVQLFQNDKNVGHTRAVNQGCKLSNGKYILLLDADTELNIDCVNILATFLFSHPNVSMAAPKTYLSDGSLQDSGKNFPSPINGIFGRQSYLTRLFPGNPFSRRYLVLTNNDLSEPIPVEYVSAACMLFRRNVYNKVGEWDEQYHSYWVDADWCKRIQLTGGKIYYIPQAVIVHHEQNHRSFKKSPNRIIWFHTGAYRFYCKHYTKRSWDPRRWITAAILTTRTMILLITNNFKKTSSSRVDPLTMQKNKSFHSKKGILHMTSKVVDIFSRRFPKDKGIP